MKNFKAQPWVLPQPVAIIGTYNEDGTPNAMNAAWVAQCDHDKLIITMGNHATTDNLARCGEFTVAFATEETVVAADYVGVVSGRKEPHKVEKTGWKAIKGEKVNAPVFDVFPMTMECRILQKSGEQEGGYMLFGEILNIQVDEKYIGTNGRLDVEKMKIITFDPVNNTYIVLGHTVGHAFRDGHQLK